jgi:two-component sensor histidine kinase
LHLSAAAAQLIGMALHELATNAGKYGALSSPTGKILIVWLLEGERLHLCWTERNGPSVLPPRRHGFGTRVMVTAPRMELRGDVTLDYAPEGLRWHLECPAERLKAASKEAA